MQKDEVEFYGELKVETTRGYLVFDGVNEIWLPKSQVKGIRLMKKDDYEFRIPIWLAKAKGII